MTDTDTFKPRTIATFWSRVDKSGECWLWTGAKGHGGYGVFQFSKTKQIRAHRMAWILTFGAIPIGLCVCHACDNRVCVNPNHLWLGTLYANIEDARVKGKFPRGERNPARKPEVRLKLSQIGKLQVGVDNHYYGKHHSEESKRKIREANRKSWLKKQGILFPEVNAPIVSA